MPLAATTRDDDGDDRFFFLSHTHTHINTARTARPVPQRMHRRGAVTARDGSTVTRDGREGDLWRAAVTVTRER